MRRVGEDAIRIAYRSTCSHCARRPLPDQRQQARLLKINEQLLSSPLLKPARQRQISHNSSVNLFRKTDLGTRTGQRVEHRATQYGARNFGTNGVTQYSLFAIHQQNGLNNGILKGERARAALGCGNPGVTSTRRKACDLPCLWVGEPVTYVQAPS